MDHDQAIKLIQEHDRAIRQATCFGGEATYEAVYDVRIAVYKAIVGRDPTPQEKRQLRDEEDEYQNTKEALARMES